MRGAIPYRAGRTGPWPAPPGGAVIGLDLAVLLATTQPVVARAVRLLLDQTGPIAAGGARAILKCTSPPPWGPGRNLVAVAQRRVLRLIGGGATVVAVVVGGAVVAVVVGGAVEGDVVVVSFVRGAWLAATLFKAAAAGLGE